MMPMQVLTVTTMLSVLAYVMGSLSSAILVCRFSGLPDPRTLGSQNPGATNVLRLGGKRAALLTFLGDACKGMPAILLARWIDLPQEVMAWLVFMGVLGHIYPIFFAFKGGKGVATVLGSLIAFQPMLGLLALLTWGIVAAIFRYASLASLSMAGLLPIYAYLMQDRIISVIIFVLLSGLIFYRHHQNIYKLWMGQESKIGEKR